MKDASYRLGLISDCIQRSRNSLRKWFDRVPNLAVAGDKLAVDNELAAGDKLLAGELPVPNTQPVSELEERYIRMRAVLREETEARQDVLAKPQNLREFQEAMTEILDESRRRINSAASEEEVRLRFRGALRRIKALL